MAMSNGVTGGVFANLADLQASRPRSNTRLQLIERANAQYIVQPVGYMSQDGDLTCANNTVAALQIDGEANVRWFGAVGDNSTDDYQSFQDAFNRCQSDRKRLYITRGNYYLSNRVVASNTFDINSDRNATMRWDGTSEQIGILFDFQESSDTLTEINLPCLFGPAISSSFSLPGYGSGGQDPSTRIGSAIELMGSNRINIYIHIANGFQDAVLVKSTSSSTVDNVNITINTSDFCEKCLNIDTTGGTGVAQLVFKANTVWAKYPLYFNTTTGYVNGCNFNIEGTAFSNEIGGCGVYALGQGVRSSSVAINQLQAGYRADSTSDSPVIITPSGTMSATPVQGEVISQASSGASGTVITNADYPLSTTTPFAIMLVSGTFDTSGELSGSTSGALGAGSVPSSIKGFTAPFVGGNGTCNGSTFDAETMGEIGYFQGSYCDIKIGVPAFHPTGSTDGAFNLFPTAGDSVRIRDNGLHNKINILSLNYTGSDRFSTPLTVSNTVGESNFNGGTGAAVFADFVYCQMSISSLAAGASVSSFLYHAKSSDNNTLLPVDIVLKNEGALNNEIDLVAFNDSTTNNRQIRINAFNRSSTTFTGNVFFWLKVG